MSKEERTSRRVFAKQVIGFFAGIVAGAGGYYLLTTPSRGTEQEVRALMNRFVDAQNARDLATVSDLLWDSPQFLYITGGEAVWGPEAAQKIFGQRYKDLEAWKLEPDLAQTQFIPLSENGDVWLAFMPMDFTFGLPGEPAQVERDFTNFVIRRTQQGWRIASILPIEAATS